MSSTVINLFRPFRSTTLNQGWSNQEMAEFYRVRELLSKVGIAVEIDFGISDDGAPWACFLTSGPGDVIIHFAVIDGVYVASSDMGHRGFRGADFREVIDAILSASEQKASIVRDRLDPTVTVHPASVLACLIITMLCSDGGLGFDSLPSGGAIGAATSGPGASKLIASLRSYDQVEESGGLGGERRDRVGALNSGFVAQQLAHEVASHSDAMRSGLVVHVPEGLGDLLQARSVRDLGLGAVMDGAHAEHPASLQGDTTGGILAEAVRTVFSPPQGGGAQGASPGLPGNLRASIDPIDIDATRQQVEAAGQLKGESTITNGSHPGGAFIDRTNDVDAKFRPTQAVTLDKADSVEIRSSLSEMMADEMSSSSDAIFQLGDYLDEYSIIFILPADKEGQEGLENESYIVDVELLLLEKNVNEFIEIAGSIGVVVDGDDIYIFDLNVFDAPNQELWIETIDAEFGEVVLVGLAFDFV